MNTNSFSFNEQHWQQIADDEVQRARVLAGVGCPEEWINSQLQHNVLEKDFCILCVCVLNV